MCFIHLKHSYFSECKIFLYLIKQAKKFYFYPIKFNLLVIFASETKIKST
jgi:hypothetical protein